MDIISNIILAIIQGLTEFLPVSSSGHIELGKAILGVELKSSQGLIYTTVLHVGTAFSTLFVFRKDISQLLMEVFQGDKTSLRYVGMIALSLIPAGLVGVWFNDVLESLFESNITLVGITLLVTSALLWSTKIRVKEIEHKPTLKMAIAMGLMQAVAILPGISRSGSTIAAGIHTGVSRQEISKFSFLMVLPLILGKIVLDIPKIANQNLGQGLEVSQLILGLFISFIVGVFACKWMVKLVTKNGLHIFAIYCMIVGILSLMYQVF